MGRIGTAFRAFFRCLGNSDTARDVDAILRGQKPALAIEARPEAKPVEKPQPKAPPAPARSEALTLLAALQREARFVDFIREPLEGFSDAQIGAAARDVHRGSAKVLERMFGLQPLLTDGEGATVEVPAGFDSARFHLTGNVSGAAPHRGRLVHSGWQATRCELPAWTGSSNAQKIVAPAEVEL